MPEIVPRLHLETLTPLPRIPCQNCQFQDFLWLHKLLVLGTPLTGFEQSRLVCKLAGIYFICKNDSPQVAAHEHVDETW